MEMLAQRIHRYGPPEVMQLESLPVPYPKAGESLVRVAAAGVGPWDALVRGGHSGLPQPLPLTPGADLSVERGDGPAALPLGTRIYGVTNGRFTGAYAEYAVVDSDRIARKPGELDLIEAASIPVVAVTAWKMLVTFGRIERGMHVLVHGASGNVGSLAVQMAHSMQTTVTALGTPTGAPRLRALGADTVLDYDARPFERAVPPADLVIDTIGGDIQRRSFAVLKRGGALISSVSVPDAALAKEARVRAEYFIVDIRADDLTRISSMISAGTIKPDVAVVMPLAEAPRAHEMLAHPEPGAHGKIVLSVADLDRD